MKFELPDNAREAFQFLSLGVAIVLAIRLVVAGFGLWPDHAEEDSLAEACAPFRNGYPLLGTHAMVVGGLELIPRMAVAGLFALCCAVLLGLSAWSISRMLRGGGNRSLVIGGRIGLLVGGAWAIYCLVCLPAEWTEVKKDELVLHQHASFLGEIPWPFTGTETHYRLSHVEQFMITSPPDKDPAIIAYAASDVFVITKPPSWSETNPLFVEQWGPDAARLVATLEALPR